MKKYIFFLAMILIADAAFAQQHGWEYALYSDNLIFPMVAHDLPNGHHRVVVYEPVDSAAGAFVYIDTLVISYNFDEYGQLTKKDTLGGASTLPMTAESLIPLANHSGYFGTYRMNTVERKVFLLDYSFHELWSVVVTPGINYSAMTDFLTVSNNALWLSMFSYEPGLVSVSRGSLYKFDFSGNYNLFSESSGKYSIDGDHIYCMKLDTIDTYNMSGAVLAKHPFLTDTVYHWGAGRIGRINENKLFVVNTHRMTITDNSFQLLFDSTDYNYFMFNTFPIASADGGVMHFDIAGVFHKTDSLFKDIWHYPNFWPGTRCATSDGGFLGTMGIAPLVNTGGGIKIYRFLSTGSLFNCQISGRAFIDMNGNCSYNPTDLPIKNVLVTAVDNGTNVTHFGFTDSLGFYQIPVPTGSHSIQWQNPNPYLIACDTSTVDVNMGQNDSVSVNFAMTALTSCPLIDAQLSQGPKIRCGLSTDWPYTYVAQLCNHGLDSAFGTYATLQIDPSIQLTNYPGNVAWASNGQGLYTVPTGTLAYGQCVTKYLQTYLPCDPDLVLGQTICAELRGYPDTLCGPLHPELWSGASIAANGTCDGDSVTLTLQNVGISATTAQLEFYIIEDNIIYFQGNFNDLGPADFIQYRVPANGATWQVICQQEPNHPGNNTLPSFFVEGCTDGASDVSTGFALMLPGNDQEPAIDQDCAIYSASLDPNAKTGFPLGRDDAHYIEQGTDLEYTLHFQNTGNDTAFLVILRDTLPPELNPATIWLGPGSHPYTFQLVDGRIAKFTFQNIVLPDSATNPTRSMGFVSFRISQKPKLALGAEIKNSVAIYFDYNAAIITNTTLHTISENVLQVSVHDPKKPSSKQANVWPIPISQSAQFEWSNAGLLANRLTIFDAQGRLVAQQDNVTSKFIWHRGNQPNGAYFFRITTADGRFTTGKLILGD